MGYPVADVIAFLRGTWLIERDIVDARGAALGAFSGTAEFAARWQLVELGRGRGVAVGRQTHSAATTQRAGRRLLVAVRPDVPCVVDVAFDDGRFFHRADLSSGSDTFVHGCAPDTYYGSWTVVSPDRFRLTWDVEGPAKQITIRSTYSRA